MARPGNPTDLKSLQLLKIVKIFIDSENIMVLVTYVSSRIFLRRRILIKNVSRTSTYSTIEDRPRVVIDNVVIDWESKEDLQRAGERHRI